MNSLANPLSLAKFLPWQSSTKRKKPQVLNATIQPPTKQRPNSHPIGPITLQDFLHHKRIPFVQGSETTNNNDYMIFIYMRSDQRIIVNKPSLNAAMLWIIDNWNQIDWLKNGNAIYHNHRIQDNLKPSPEPSPTNSFKELPLPGLLATPIHASASLS